MNCPRCSGLIGPDTDQASPYRYECMICKRRYEEDDVNLDPYKECGKNVCIKHKAKDSVFCEHHRDKTKQYNDKQKAKNRAKAYDNIDPSKAEPKNAEKELTLYDKAINAMNEEIDYHKAKIDALIEAKACLAKLED